MLYNENKDMDYMRTHKLLGETCSRLANNFVCLKWAHENGFTWDEVSCQEAAKFGNIKCLKYLHENGCPWDQKTVNACMSYNQKKCLDYAREHKCPGYERAVTYMHFYQERYQD